LSLGVEKSQSSSVVGRKFGLGGKNIAIFLSLELVDNHTDLC
jgi:hypothetical protein